MKNKRTNWDKFWITSIIWFWFKIYQIITPRLVSLPKSNRWNICHHTHGEDSCSAGDSNFWCIFFEKKPSNSVQQLLIFEKLKNVLDLQNISQNVNFMLKKLVKYVYRWFMQVFSTYVSCICCSLHDIIVNIKLLNSYNNYALRFAVTWSLGESAAPSPIQPPTILSADHFAA